MATGTGKWFTRAGSHMAKGEVIWKASGGSAVRIALMKAAYTPAQDTNEYWSDISANECDATGNYVAEGELLTMVDAAYDAATNETRLKASNKTWASSTITASHAVVYVDTGTPSTSPLLGFITFDTAQSSSNGDFTVTFDATTGVLKMTAAA